MIEASLPGTNGLSGSTTIGPATDVDGKRQITVPFYGFTNRRFDFPEALSMTSLCSESFRACSFVKTRDATVVMLCFPTNEMKSTASSGLGTINARR